MKLRTQKSVTGAVADHCVSIIRTRKQIVSRFFYYAMQAAKFSRDERCPHTFTDILRLFPKWNQSLGSTPMDERTPWMTYAAIHFLDKILKPEMRVFEWGVGGSTVYFAERVGEIVSAEHDVEWAMNVQRKMERINHPSWQIFIVEPTVNVNPQEHNCEDITAYASALAEYVGMSFAGYAKVIEQYTDASFDVVLVDGRCRPSCAMHGVRKVKPGGYLFLDDADRSRYAWVQAQMADLKWKPIRLAGPGPCLWEFRETCAWQRPLP